VSGLPINANTIRVVQGALLIYDAAAALWYTSDTQTILLAIGQAVSDGGHAALNLAPGVRSRPASAATPPPEPVFTGAGANVRSLR
jgi:hypothetical protein